MSLSNASITRLANSAPLKAAQDILTIAHVLDRAIQIQQIPAPTFHEEARATFIAEQFRALGLQDVSQDSLYNVYGWLPATNPDAPILLISAHTDTVFPADAPLDVRQEGTRVYGPGLGDNSLGVAALLVTAEAFLQYPIPHTARLCFVANSREEGLGDLGGINGAIDFLGDQLSAAIVLEGMALGRIYHEGIAVRRLKVTATAPGGHSWLHFGSPSAIHSLIEFSHDLLSIPPTNDPRTTYNIGLIEGGTSVNTIAAHASCHIDLRSTDTSTLHALEERIRAIAARHSTGNVTFGIEVVGDRPAGSITPTHPLVRLAVEAHQAIRMTPELESGSTDANALLARGIPTVCVGVSYGGNAHVMNEYIEVPPIEQGMWQLLLLTAAAANLA